MYPSTIFKRTSSYFCRIVSIRLLNLPLVPPLLRMNIARQLGFVCRSNAVMVKMGTLLNEKKRI